MKNHIKKAGHTLIYLSPYLPDLNPIEYKLTAKKAERQKTQVDIEKFFWK